MLADDISARTGKRIEVTKPALSFVMIPFSTAWDSWKKHNPINIIMDFVEFICFTFLFVEMLSLVVVHRQDKPICLPATSCHRRICI